MKNTVTIPTKEIMMKNTITILTLLSSLLAAHAGASSIQNNSDSSVDCSNSSVYYGDITKVSEPQINPKTGQNTFEVSIHIAPGLGAEEGISTFIYDYNAEQYEFLKTYDRGDSLVITMCNKKDYYFSAPSEYSLSPFSTITDNSYKDKKALEHSSSSISMARWQRGEIVAFSSNKKGCKLTIIGEKTLRGNGHNTQVFHVQSRPLCDHIFSLTASMSPVNFKSSDQPEHEDSQSTDQDYTLKEEKAATKAYIFALTGVED